MKIKFTLKTCNYGVIHKGRPHEGGWRMRTLLLILPVKGKIMRTSGEGGKNGKILRTSFMSNLTVLLRFISNFVENPQNFAGVLDIRRIPLRRKRASRANSDIQRIIISRASAFPQNPLPHAFDPSLFSVRPLSLWTAPLLCGKVDELFGEIFSIM